jgi:hypothetical protein
MPIEDQWTFLRAKSVQAHALDETTTGYAQYDRSVDKFVEAQTIGEKKRATNNEGFFGVSRLAVLILGLLPAGIAVEKHLNTVNPLQQEIAATLSPSVKNRLGEELQDALRQRDDAITFSGASVLMILALGMGLVVSDLSDLRGAKKRLAELEKDWVRVKTTEDDPRMNKVLDDQIRAKVDVLTAREAERANELTEVTAQNQMIFGKPVPSGDDIRILFNYLALCKIRQEQASPVSQFEYLKTQLALLEAEASLESPFDFVQAKEAHGFQAFDSDAVQNVLQEKIALVDRQAQSLKTLLDNTALHRTSPAEDLALVDLYRAKSPQQSVVDIPENNSLPDTH